MVSFVLPEELRMLRENLRRYVDTEMIPREMESVDGDEFRPGCQEKFQEGMKQARPLDDGRAGRIRRRRASNLLAKSIVWAELGRTIAIPARGDIDHRPDRARASSTRLKARCARNTCCRSCAARRRACFAQTEPDAGSDPGGMRTTAVRDGDHYVINGTKRFITGAEQVRLHAIDGGDRPFARARSGGISCFLVDMDTPGVKLGAQYETMMGDQPVGDHSRQRARAGDATCRR